MKKRISSFLFAMSIFGGVAHAETEYKAVSATLTYDEAALATEAGAAEVLESLELQAERACRKVSLVSIGLDLLHASPIGPHPARRTLSACLFLLRRPQKKNPGADLPAGVFSYLTV